MTDTIKAAAQVLAAARHAADAASEAIIEAQRTADRPKARVSAIQAERAGIIAASRGGTRDPEKALRLAVLDADLADLAPIVAETEAELAKTQVAAEEATQAAVSAEHFVIFATEDEMARRLAAHASALDALLVSTINDMARIAKSGARGARRPFWAPSPALVAELQRLHLIAAGIR